MSGAGEDAAPRTVALFASCAADLAAPGPALAALRVLAAAGLRVEVPEAQTCCGQVGLNSGHREPAKRLMRRWIEVFEPYDAVVGVSGSCVATVFHQFARVLDGEWRGRAERVAARTWEFTRFVHDRADGLDLELDTCVTWHDSCHMLRSLGEKSAPRQVLGRVRGLTLAEAADNEVCCGFGGTFALKYPELSCAMADGKLDDFAATRSGGRTPEQVVSADATCLLHLSLRAQARGLPLRTVHIAELLAAALPGGPRSLPADARDGAAT
ncbi:(Fe-S)-binding protein [Allonocardiopsis opalescens]|uniref:L-lactate dehydrogenase complex protein LldE n=1 Tax=Allonocardiopsis opalescens TaxID=1144618 RepID=A0A2T0QE63_9ACTN|nr:(Fe-S)-binding protein [Allonocardiopsis opalescens]PRY02227.1 L-lactate dehydrogenase complex protein LldE [Allonocardiopsis opalescens]